MKSYSKLFKKLKAYLKESQSPKRYRHSRDVSRLARKIAEMHGVDERKAEIAGLAHDVAREFSLEDIQKWCDRGGWVPEPDTLRLMLYHGHAGREFLAERFGIEDPSVLDAVRSHTIGHPGMCELAKIVYIADYCEPGRKHMTGKKRKELLSLTLDQTMMRILDEEMRYLKKNNRIISKQTAELYKVLLEERDEAGI